MIFIFCILTTIFFLVQVSFLSAKFARLEDNKDTDFFVDFYSTLMKRGGIFDQNTFSLFPYLSNREDEKLEKLRRVRNYSVFGFWMSFIGTFIVFAIFS